MNTSTVTELFDSRDRVLLVSDTCLRASLSNEPLHHFRLKAHSQEYRERGGRPAIDPRGAMNVHARVPMGERVQGKHERLSKPARRLGQPVVPHRVVEILQPPMSPEPRMGRAGFLFIEARYKSAIFCHSTVDEVSFACFVEFTNVCNGGDCSAGGEMNGDDTIISHRGSRRREHPRSVWNLTTSGSSIGPSLGRIDSNGNFLFRPETIQLSPSYVEAKREP